MCFFFIHIALHILSYNITNKMLAGIMYIVYKREKGKRGDDSKLTQKEREREKMNTVKCHLVTDFQKNSKRKHRANALYA